MASSLRRTPVESEDPMASELEKKAGDLAGKKVAILVTDGFEQVELTVPKQAIEAAGGLVYIIAPGERIQGWNHDDKADVFSADVRLDDAKALDYDALVLPGGVRNPDRLRTDGRAVKFVRAFFDASLPVAAICHAPWTLIEAGAVLGRTVTSYPSLKTDLRNAGAQWVDEEVCRDKGLVTSRSPQDLPAFCREMLREFAEGAAAALDAAE
jgi:protease I